MGWVVTEGASSTSERYDSSAVDPAGNWHCPASGGFTDPAFGRFCPVSNLFVCSVCPPNYWFDLRCATVCWSGPLTVTDCSGTDTSQVLTMAPPAPPPVPPTPPLPPSPPPALYAGTYAVVVPPRPTGTVFYGTWTVRSFVAQPFLDTASHRDHVFPRQITLPSGPVAWDEASYTTYWDGFDAPIRGEWQPGGADNPFAFEIPLLVNLAASTCCAAGGTPVPDAECWPGRRGFQVRALFSSPALTSCCTDAQHCAARTARGRTCAPLSLSHAHTLLGRRVQGGPDMRCCGQLVRFPGRPL